jgi:replicative DNA helicase
MTAMAGYLTRVPKGIFLYRNHEEANRDRDRWVVEAIVEKQRNG